MEFVATLIIITATIKLKHRKRIETKGVQEIFEEITAEKIFKDITAQIK